MKATASDIRFAETMASALRSGIVRVPNDLYFALKAKEAEACADLYDGAVKSMRATGEWSMPDNNDLARVTAAVWAELDHVH